jgi:hypothetical protein
MKMAVFWVVAPCSHRPDDGGNKHLWNVGKLLTTRRNKPEDSHLLTHRRENLKSHGDFCWLLNRNEMYE